MCGIVGIIGDPIQQSAVDAFNTLFYLNELRGGDGCGVMTVNAVSAGQPKRIGMPDVYKSSSETCDEMQCGPEYEAITKPTGLKRLLLGHARAKTKGLVSDENTHPIISENIYGVMNGTLKGARWNANPDVSDSNALFTAMGTEGVLPVLQEIKDEPYALAWHDAVEDQFFMIRSKDRPMALLKLTGDCVLFASDYLFLDFVAKYHKLSVEKDGLFELAPDTLIAWNLKETYVSKPVYVGSPVEYFEKKQVG